MDSDAETVVVRKWGHSMGVTLPPRLVAKQRIHPNDSVVITVKKVPSFMELAGTWKTKKSSQELKDEAKKGWD
jgi:antitoxin component of MazEF toxin-antitoxin module